MSYSSTVPQPSTSATVGTEEKTVIKEGEVFNAWKYVDNSVRGKTMAIWNKKSNEFELLIDYFIFHFFKFLNKNVISIIVEQ